MSETPGRALAGGPVWPTGTAIGRFRPLGPGALSLAEGHELGDWQRRNTTKTLPHCIEQIVASGAVRNLARVAEGRVGDVPHEGWHFSDSDVYKLLEAIAWESLRGLSAGVEEFVEEVAALLARAQRQDGYLNSWFQGQHPELIWKDLRWGHELYCAGHLLQAAVAGERAGRLTLSTVARRLVGHLLSTFSSEDGDGLLVGVCGHPEIEAALVEFYRLTGDTRVLELAKRQVELRGRPDVALPASGLLGDSRFPLSYFLHHLPVRERALATGHAVRELYLQAGVVDVAVETGDEVLLAASEAIWS
ncbi:MAG TPA: beta-L-arabinofuranosidase domain-containing protein, partial [Acidimicrobiales bacterium]|nr:beta-L-arabinofuranosidase domain-containing protein [Acidimicrobiales bacterium]